MIPVSLLVSAYREGIFPMALEDGEIGWFSPDPRGIIPLDTFHVSRRLQRVVRSAASAMRAKFRRPSFTPELIPRHTMRPVSPSRLRWRWMCVPPDELMITSNPLMPSSA